MMDDAQLLRSYAADRSDAAFAELVRRHLNFVYAAALRQANGDAHLAQDAAQLVFTDLARKAATLAGRPVLTGWLFTSTRFAVSKLVRGERRRQVREQEAHMMHETLDDPAAQLDWERVRPVLDEALAGLSDADREAVLLRFFEGHDFAGIGAKLHLSENAARMRVGRALDKLQAQLARRGLTSSTTALAVVLANQVGVAAPAGLAATVTSTALAGVAVAGTAGLVATFMTMNKLTLGLAGSIIVAGATGFVVQARTNTELRTELQTLRQENQAIATLQAGNLRLARTSAEVAAMRADDTALAQLGEEAEALKGRMNRAVQVAAEAGARRAVYDVARLDRVPRVLTQVRPKYPAELKSSGVGGEVVVDFVVDATGVVRNAYVARSNVRELEAAAIEAVSQWTFEAGHKGGRAVNTHLQVPIVFAPAPDQQANGTLPPDTAGKKFEVIQLAPLTVERKP
jgi:RNA polymerase sigma factor (sigma-70 family)